jgi:hypothetical protein
MEVQPFRCHLVSDVHIRETYPDTLIRDLTDLGEKRAPVLVLLGDIGYPANPEALLLYEKFVDEVSKLFQTVIIVPGREFLKNLCDHQATLNTTTRRI